MCPVISLILFCSKESVYPNQNATYTYKNVPELLSLLFNLLLNLSYVHEQFCDILIASYDIFFYSYK